MSKTGLVYVILEQLLLSAFFSMTAFLSASPPPGTDIVTPLTGLKYAELPPAVVINVLLGASFGAVCHTGGASVAMIRCPLAPTTPLC